MNIFVLNCGSSSVKYQLLDMNTETVLAKGQCERVGIEGTFLVHKRSGQDDYLVELGRADHTACIREVLKALTDAKVGVLESVEEIHAVGHRVVHAGEKFSGSVCITDEVKAALEECIDLAPLHNPPNLAGIRACERLLPGVPQVGVFDTAFHQTLEPKAYLYAIPYEYYQKYRVRRYGFHGTSHRFVAERTAELMGRPLAELKLIICHLGNGASISAVKGGKSVDTSMGFTPLEGLVMGTRSGDLDPALIEFISKKEGLTVEQVTNILNKKSGVLGLSGIGSDMRDIEMAIDQGNEQAKLTYEVYTYRLRKYIGAYVAAMDGVDAIVFTAGVGENDWLVRQMTCEGLTYLGITIDEALNKQRGKARAISTPESRVQVWVVPTNEELAIARDTLKLAR
ncbi:MAG: acetate kinase [Bacillota bacterium]